MTTNAFIFSWDMYGVESIIPITQYEDVDKLNMWRLLQGEQTQRNPLNSIMQALLLRARVNTQRHYEIYAIDCDASLDEEYWKNAWDENPQLCADLIREKGTKIFSNRATRDERVRVV